MLNSNYFCLFFSLEIALKFESVVLVVIGVTLKQSLCTDKNAIAALEISFGVLKNYTLGH